MDRKKYYGLFFSLSAWAQSSYRVYATLQCSAENSAAITEINTGKLSLKVLSCGPLPQELENGDIVPALLQTYALPDVNLAIQVSKALE